MDIQFSITPSLLKLSRAYRNASKNMQKGFEDLISEFALTTERYAKQVSPVKTGRMRGSIATTFEDKGFTARVGTWNINYAKFVHEGTRFMKARPFMKYGLEFAVKKFNDKTFNDRIDEELRKELANL